MPSVSRSFSSKYLPKAGGTMTGDIVLENAVALVGRTTAAQDVSLARVRADNVTIYGDIFGWVNSSLQDGGTSMGFQQIQKRPTTLADQTITAAGALTIAHGLGAAPMGILAFAYCQTAEGNFTQGVEYPIGPLHANGDVTAPRGHILSYDATNVYVRFAATPVFVLKDPTTGATQSMTTLSNWRLRLKVFP